MSEVRPIVNSRACAARGCKRLSRPNGFFCSDACRARTWKENHPGYDPRSGRENAGERLSRVSNGGLQVSVGRMLSVLQGEPFYMTETWAKRLVARALSERQRQRFAAHAAELPGQLNLEEEAAA